MHTLRTLGNSGVKVSPIGLGCMGMSAGYGTATEEESLATLNAAIDQGCTFWDTADIYGQNEELLAKVLLSRRKEVFLCTKFSISFNEKREPSIRGDREYVLQACERSLKRLGVDQIDLYYQHRVDPKTPIEETVGAMAELVKQGKVRFLGLSESSAATIRRAHAVHPIAAVQTEYSLWTRNPEIAVLDACRELGTTFVAFSPLGRAFLTGVLRDVAALAPGDLRRTMPRFEPETYAKNLALLDGFAKLAADVGCTMAQLALAWTLAKVPHIVAIPGTTSLAHLAENFKALDVRLSADVMAALDALINEKTVTGPRYNAAAQADVDTEEFA